MEIKIDTQKDSKDDIKKVIVFLQELVRDDYSKMSSNVDTVGSVVEDSGVFGMFDDNKEKLDEEPKEKPPRVEIIEW